MPSSATKIIIIEETGNANSPGFTTGRHPDAPISDVKVTKQLTIELPAGISNADAADVFMRSLRIIERS